MEQKLPKFDYISDLHLDFYINPSKTGQKLAKNMEKFLTKILPKNVSKVLLIAGDISHYNNQTISFLETASKIYETVCYCFGNHDFYLISEKQLKKYKNSLNRINEVIKHNFPKNVHFMDGFKIVEVDGMKIGGSSCWYDCSMTEKTTYWMKETVIDHWMNYMNDYKFMYLEDNVQGFDPYEFSKIMNKNVKNNLKQCDIFISHIQPVYSHFMRDNDPANGYYSFYGEKMLYEVDERIWIYGHTHIEHDYELGPHRFLCNPLGYPSQSHNRRIKTFDLVEKKVIL